MLKSYYNSLRVLLLQLPIVTGGIASSESQVLPQLHIKACIATSVCKGNIQIIQTIIRHNCDIFIDSYSPENLQLHNF